MFHPQLKSDSDVKSTNLQETERRTEQSGQAPSTLSLFSASQSNIDEQANRLRQATNGRLDRASNVLLSMQNQYGNQYTQRVINTQKSAPLQRKVDDDEESEIQRKVSDDDEEYEIQRKTNQATSSGGREIPFRLQSGLQHLSGMNLSDVRVHYNSDQPAKLNALAYAQDNDIHLGPGQEHHLPHEAWHVVQQKQGRVNTTTHVAGKPVNDSNSLESEANTMGAKATSLSAYTPQNSFEANSLSLPRNTDSDAGQIQRKTGTSPIQMTAFNSVTFVPQKNNNLRVELKSSFARIISAQFSMTGSARLTGGTNAEAAKWKLGTIQTMYKDSMENTYKLSEQEKGGKIWLEKYSTGGSLRDGDVNPTPWYDSGDIKTYSTTPQTKATALDDEPETDVKWNASKNRGRLFRSRGEMSFCMWMIALHDDKPMEPIYLNYQEWSLNWSITFNYASNGSKTVNHKSGETVLGKSGGGKGLKKPNLAQRPVANDKANRDSQTRWVQK